MPDIVIRDGGTLEQWIAALTNGCVCGGRTVATDAFSDLDLTVRHYPPGKLEPSFNRLSFALKSVQWKPDDVLASYADWLEGVHSADA